MRMKGERQHGCQSYESELSGVTAGGPPQRADHSVVLFQWRLFRARAAHTPTARGGRQTGLQQAVWRRQHCRMRLRLLSRLAVGVLRLSRPDGRHSQLMVEDVCSLGCVCLLRHPHTSHLGLLKVAQVGAYARASHCQSRVTLVSSALFCLCMQVL